MGKLIDINRKYNGGISGDYVISLMENYVNAKLSGMTCKVLRVFKTRNNSQPVNVTAKKSKQQNKKNLNTAFEDLDPESYYFKNHQPHKAMSHPSSI